MQISLNWLKSFIDCPLSSSAFASLLTQSGLEVTHIHSTIQHNLDGLIVGDIRSCLPHPNADKLKKVIVDVGTDQPLVIICGAPNIRSGLKVVVAPVGSVIYNYHTQQPFQIKKVKIRGELSEGMICAEDEIGLGTDHEGVITLTTTLPAGIAVQQHFKDALDEILTIEITPNRADACSHLGIARDLKAILHLPIMLPDIDRFQTTPLSLPLHLDAIDADLCPRYCGLLLQKVAIQPSPYWLRSRLERIGVKSINNVVDITNFVLHECGQPLHAFDYDTIVGKKISVKQCRAGEHFIGLDGIERLLKGNELMIYDGAGPIAMAGIMGGLRTRITHATQHIFIESAYFNSSIIQCAAQEHHLKTDASFRFERGTDPNMPPYALKRAAVLLQSLLPSVEISTIIDIYPLPVPHYTIPITYTSIRQCLGVEIPPAIVKQIIADLEIVIESETDTGFTAKVPPYRIDVTRPIDLIEEIVRIYGYNAIPTTGHLASGYLATESKIDNAYKAEQEISSLLTANGYYEIWKNSLIKSNYMELLSEHTSQVISILNPLSTSLNILRPTLLFSGLEAIAYNLARRYCDLKFFEFGTVYSQADIQYKEEKRLSIWLTGQTEPPNWVRQLGAVTMHNLRHTIEQLTQKLGLCALCYGVIAHPFYAQAIQVTYQGMEVITFGQVRTSILDYFSIEQPIYLADINWKLLLKSSQTHKIIYEPIAKFPPVRRDLSLVVDQSISFQHIKDLIYKQDYKSIQDIHLFDVYQGANLPFNKKSYALSFTLQDKEKTLDNKSIDKILNHLIQTFENNLNAIIRR